jgi:hypothetical protein
MLYAGSEKWLVSGMLASRERSGSGTITLRKMLMPKIFRTDVASEADLKVYVTDVRSEADLIIFETSDEWAASEAFIWTYTQTKSEADKVVFLTDLQWEADLVIYRTEVQPDAGWVSVTKAYLL